MSALLPSLVASIAESKIGLRESGGNNKGADIQEFFNADSYKPNKADNGYAWCAAFVCRIVQLAMQKSGKAFTFQRPTTPGAWAFIEWSLAQDNSTWTKRTPGSDIQRGDLIVYTFSHIGIATSGVDDRGYFTTCEGNTNEAGSREGDGVYRKSRHTSQVKARIRFQV
tara:strand:- start:212 stop:715 length:504 start_codon:yes stop_codon:yes gene_type:complete